jgi:hypothetical protein
MKKLPITDATDAQLKWFAQNVQQIENVPQRPRRLLAALIASGHKAISSSSRRESEQSRSTQSSRARPVRRVERAGRQDAADRLRLLARIRRWSLAHYADRPPRRQRAGAPVDQRLAALVIQRGKLVEIPYDFYLVLKQAGGTKIGPASEADRPLVRSRTIRNIR